LPTGEAQKGLVAAQAEGDGEQQASQKGNRQNGQGKYLTGRQGAIARFQVG
jgi:hypothetical protein